MKNITEGEKKIKEITSTLRAMVEEPSERQRAVMGYLILNSLQEFLTVTQLELLKVEELAF